jgi:hypothetical protein
MVLLTLLHAPTSRAQSTVCNRVWVEVRPNDLMGNSDLAAPPSSRYPATFCFVVYDRGTARFSLEPDDPAERPFTSLMLRKREHDSHPGMSSYARSTADYDEERIRGRNDFLFLRTVANGERHYGATVTNLTAKVTLSWTVIFDPRGPRLDEVPPPRGAARGSQVAAKRAPTTR